MNLLRHDRPLGLAPASVRDYRELARRRLPRQLFDYIDGDETESERRLATSVLGHDLSLPVVLAPVGLGGMFARRAEAQAARAAARVGVPFCESTVSICSIEEVAAATPDPFWYQLYVMRDRAYAEDLMGRAHAVGCPVLVLTVDLPVVGARCPAA